MSPRSIRPAVSRRTVIRPRAGSRSASSGPKSLRSMLAMVDRRDPATFWLLPLTIPVWIVHDFAVYVIDRGFLPKKPRGHTLNWRHPAAYVLLPFIVLGAVVAAIVFNPLTLRYLDSRRERRNRIGR